MGNTGMLVEKALVAIFNLLLDLGALEVALKGVAVPGCGNSIGTASQSR
jgi:hypothetical protein